MRGYCKLYGELVAMWVLISVVVSVKWKTSDKPFDTNTRFIKNCGISREIDHDDTDHFYWDTGTTSKIK